MHWLKSSVIQAQETVINLQNELLAAKDEQLDSVPSAVHSAVQLSVKSEIKSYSDAVNSAQKPHVPAIKTLKKVVEQVVQADDRSKNFVVFGLKEETDEDTGKLIDGVLECVRGEAEA